MWFKRTPVPIILGGIMSVQIKPRFIREKKSNESQLIALAADDFEMLVPCSRSLSDFCGVCSVPPSRLVFLR
jgi:hypothetical protein